MTGPDSMYTKHLRSGKFALKVPCVTTAGQQSRADWKVSNRKQKLFKSGGKWDVVIGGW